MNKYLSLKFKILSFFSIILVVFLHSYNIVVNFDTEVILLDKGYKFLYSKFF
ncbi:hypothetical protein HNQ02_003088 [Flavobacterium sp. 7E]|nr:hypothetical protein [Flavobacterium sp. 7E]